MTRGNGKTLSKFVLAIASLCITDSSGAQLTNLRIGTTSQFTRVAAEHDLFDSNVNDYVRYNFNETDNGDVDASSTGADDGMIGNVVGAAVIQTVAHCSTATNHRASAPYLSVTYGSVLAALAPDLGDFVSWNSPCISEAQAKARYVVEQEVSGIGSTSATMQIELSCVLATNFNPDNEDAGSM